MKIQSNNFISEAEIAIKNQDLQAAVDLGTRVAFNKRNEAMSVDGAEHGEKMRQQAAAAKRRALNKLPELLEEAELNMQANGIEVLWAIDAKEANQQVIDIAQDHSVKFIAKSKSMLTEEIDLNHALEDSGLEVIETDLGEFIVQLSEEPPSHIVAPIMHKTKATVRDTLIRKVKMPPTDDTEEMTGFARKYLREKFLQADMGLSGGNFIVAETGSLCLVTNEGNGRMVTTLPKIHVALVGIEKVVATVEDYATLTQILPRSATGQLMTVYTNIINGPRRSDETDGPEHLYVILVDNGRSRIYSGNYVEALCCIRCGACLNGCPVYRATGGHAYGWIYQGPIGAILTPLLNGIENATPLPHASSLCGTCKQICPVDIDIPRMLLDLRNDLTEQKLAGKKWSVILQIWAFIHQSPFLFASMSKVAVFFQRVGLLNKVSGPLGGWKKHRTIPVFAKKSFRQLWKEGKLQKDPTHGE